VLSPAGHAPRKIVLAYSGGLDTSCIIPWLKEQYGDCEVIAAAVDVGQPDDLSQIEAKALASGASKAYVIDAREEFLREYAFPTLRAGAIYERKYLLGTSIARPVIAKHQVEIALLEGADAVAHGCTGKGNDQVRFELTYQALAPHLTVIAPWRSWHIRSREDAIAYAAAHDVPVQATTAKIYSLDGNLWHLSHEGGALEDPWNEPPEDAYSLSVAPEQAPDTPAYLTLEFEEGWPVSLDGQRLEPLQLVEALNAIGGEHGIGRIDLLENRLVGMKSRGVYETPGGTILLVAHRGIESITLDRGAAHLKDELMPKYAELIYNGFWYAPEREMLQALIDRSQEFVSGEVTIKLYKGSASVIARSSPYSLYSMDLVTFEEGSGTYDHHDAEGFIRLNALRLKTYGARNRRAGK
jgi:argininosuccinate synthase